MDNFLNYFDAEDLVIAAQRYYLGGMTIATCDFARRLANSWNTLPKRAKFVIRQDLEEAFRLDDKWRKTHTSMMGSPLGMGMDRRAWQEVKDAWEEEEK